MVYLSFAENVGNIESQRRVCAKRLIPISARKALRRMLPLRHGATLCLIFIASPCIASILHKHDFSRKRSFAFLVELIWLMFVLFSSAQICWFDCSARDCSFFFSAQIQSVDRVKVLIQFYWFCTNLHLVAFPLKWARWHCFLASCPCLFWMGKRARKTHGQVQKSLGWMATALLQTNGCPCFMRWNWCLLGFRFVNCKHACRKMWIKSRRKISRPGIGARSREESKEKGMGRQKLSKALGRRQALPSKQRWGKYFQASNVDGNFWWRLQVLPRRQRLRKLTKLRQAFPRRQRSKLTMPRRRRQVLPGRQRLSRSPILRRRQHILIRQLSWLTTTIGIGAHLHQNKIKKYCDWTTVEPT